MYYKENKHLEDRNYAGKILDSQREHRESETRDGLEGVSIG